MWVSIFNCSRGCGANDIKVRYSALDFAQLFSTKVTIIFLLDRFKCICQVPLPFGNRLFKVSIFNNCNAPIQLVLQMWILIYSTIRQRASIQTHSSIRRELQCHRIQIRLMFSKRGQFRLLLRSTEAFLLRLPKLPRENTKCEVLLQHMIS